MKRQYHLIRPIRIIRVAMLLLFTLALMPLPGTLADSTYQSLPFSQNWSNTSLITTNDDWSGVPGIVGYHGDGLTGSTDTDPQTILADGTTTPIDVNANKTNPDTFTWGGLAEFEITNPVVALQGSVTAAAPFILIHVNTTGITNITVSYNLRDIDGSADDAQQQVALHYRVGTTGNFTNVSAAYVADATTGGAATKVTPVNVTLPADADNQPQLQIRMMTTDASGDDEWVGVDDISITGTPTAVTLSSFTAHPIASQATFFRWQWLALAGAVVAFGGVAVARGSLRR